LQESRAADERRAVDNFPAAVREILEKAKRDGLPFGEAWSQAMHLVRPKDQRGWGGGREGGGGESPLSFLKRVMHDAYYGRGPNLHAFLDRLHLPR
jgi:hypothetical protein